MEGRCLAKGLWSYLPFVTPWTVACQVPPSMEFSRQEYWSEFSEALSDSEIKPGLLYCRQILYHLSHQGSPLITDLLSISVWFVSSLMLHLEHLISIVQSLSHVWFFVISWTASRQASLSITNPRSSLRLTSIESVMPASHLKLACTMSMIVQ